MPYTRPNAYNNEDPINGDEVRENHEELRAFVNRGVRTADLDNEIVDWTHILAGEYAHVTTDHRFTTGNHYATAVDSAAAHQSATGSSMKVTGVETEFYVPVIGKEARVNVENAIALVTAYLQVVPIRDELVEGADGASDDVYLFVDGEQVAATKAQFFANGETAGVSSDAGGSLSSRLRVATFHTLVPALDVGLHTFEVKLDPWHTVSLIRARSLDVEIFEA